MAISKQRIALFILLLGLGTLNAQSDDSNQFSHALAFSRDFMFKRHLVADGTLEPRESNGHKEVFKYDRYPDVERIRLDNGDTFARKHGGSWLESDDWAKTGKPVTAEKASELDSRVEIAKVAWVALTTGHDASQGAETIKLVGRKAIKDGERLAFERTREHPTNPPYPHYSFIRYSDWPKEDLLLEQFTGPIVLGDQKLFLTVNYDTFIALKDADLKIIKKSSPRK